MEGGKEVAEEGFQVGVPQPREVGEREAIRRSHGQVSTSNVWKSKKKSFERKINEREKI